MSAQTNSRNRSRSARRPRRRAASADGAMAAALERDKAKVNEAMAAGINAVLNTSKMDVTIQLGNQRRKLVDGDGTVTPLGKYFYEQAGVQPPQAFPYEQGVINGKWVIGFDRKKHQVRRMTADGSWAVTPKGLQYYRYARSSYKVEIPTLEAYPGRSDVPEPAWRVSNTQGYREIRDDAAEKWTVGHLRSVTRPAPVRPMPLVATLAQREQHAKDAALAWVRARPQIVGADGQDYHTVLYDSPLLLVWDQSRPILVTEKQQRYYDRADPTADEILQRPLQDYVAIPDGCYMPWALNPESLLGDGKCAVRMLRGCLLKRVRKRMNDDGMTRLTTAYQERMTEHEVMCTLDQIFQDLYTEGEYPFTKSWREDGVTAEMILEFCKREAMICNIFHGGINSKSLMAASHVPDKYDGNTPRCDFFVNDHHCFWYNRPASEKGVSSAPDATNGIGQIVSRGRVVTEEEREEEEKEEAQRPDTQNTDFFNHTTTPPFAEWTECYDLLGVCVDGEGKCYRGPDFDQFKVERKRNGVRAKGAMKKVYMYLSAGRTSAELHSVAMLEQALRAAQRDMGDKSFSMRPLYNKSPDIPQALLIDAKDCPPILVKEVPREAEFLQSFWRKAAEVLQLGPAALVYRGESKSAVCERMRLEISKVRRQWDMDTKRRVKALQEGRCAECGVDLDTVVCHMDHRQALCQGGADDESNLHLLCITCHSEKSEIERLSGVHRRSLYSMLSRDVLEGFMAAPKPQQLVFGDGAKDCLEVDIIACRSSALTNMGIDLPVASVMDAIVPFKLRTTRPDFVFIDAGPPKENALEALPYMGTGWYHWLNAQAIRDHGINGAGEKVSDEDHFIYAFSASTREPCSVLAETYEKIHEIVKQTIEGSLFTPEEVLDDRPVAREDSIRNQYKGLILAMQGSWTTQHTYTWKAEDHILQEHAPQGCQYRRSLPDGQSRWMKRTEVLNNRTMYLIGRIPLDIEHLLMYRGYQALQKLPITIHGCINDCFFVASKKLGGKQLKAIVHNNLKGIRYHDDTEVFRVKGHRDAPECDFHHHVARRIYSPWRAVPEHEAAAANSGKWSHIVTPAPQEWRFVTEEPGLGRGPDDTFQEEVAQMVFENRGGYIAGLGGTGKSEVIKGRVADDGTIIFKGLEQLFKDAGYKRILKLGFTHVASQNVDGNTILHALHRYAKATDTVVIIDEASMVPVWMWGLLEALTFTGNVVVALGDFQGQYLPIPDRDKDLTDFDKSPFMCNLVRGLHITMQKYRRGTDHAHFELVRSIYPSNDVSLEDALAQARDKYPARGQYLVHEHGTTICKTHRCRLRVNTYVNERLAATHTDAVKIEAVPLDKSIANQNQAMQIWPGIVLNGYTTKGKNGAHGFIKNGCRYRLQQFVEAGGEQKYEFVQISEERGETVSDVSWKAVGKPFVYSATEVSTNLRLSHAITAFSAQARTIYGPLRVAQTTLKHYTLRDLIVCLGRAPEGSVVEVE